MYKSARWLVGLLFLCACPSKPEPGGSAKPEGAAVLSTAAPSSKAPSNKEAVAIALKTLEAWVSAQNQGKLDTYLGLYDASSFRGVKRTATGAEQKLTFDAWKDERSRMFAAGSTVAADAPKAVSWTDNPGLGEGVVEVRFTQRWKSARYADHGPKVVHFRVSGSAARILYEELISSTPGWDDASSPAPAAVGSVKFVRARPVPADCKGLDACAYLGGSGFACIDALQAEKDPIVSRYMRRLSDADARQSFDTFQQGKREPGDVAHAEVAEFCGDTGACGAPQRDDGQSCLIKAELLMLRKEDVASKAAHARACKCGAERAQIPVMGGFLACNGATPETRGQNMRADEAAEVRACVECDAAAGPAACTKEIERLSKSDPELAKYIAQVRVPRCSKP